MNEIQDSYNTVKTASEIEIKIKGSRFIGRAFPCQSEDEAEGILSSIRKKYYDATHHCFAYRVGSRNDQKFRYSDAGEPSGTAGKPIYDQIVGKDLTNVVLIVTRYFGGTKLGTGGLTHAYSDSASEAIEKAGIIEQFLTGQFSLIVEYSDYNIIERLIHKMEGKILARGMMANSPTITVEMRLSYMPDFDNRAIEATSGRIRIEKNA